MKKKSILKNVTKALNNEFFVIVDQKKYPDADKLFAYEKECKSLFSNKVFTLNHYKFPFIIFMA